MTTSIQKACSTGRGLTRQRIAEIRVECQSDPASIPIHREAVATFMAADLPGEALPLLRRLANLCPTDPDVARQLAQVLSVAGEPREALAQWNRVRAQQGDNEEILHNLGVAACRVEDFRAACEAFETKLALKPGCYETLNDLAVLYSILGRPEDSARSYLRCLEINPRYEKGRDNAFAFFWEQGRLEEGRRLAETISHAVGADREIEEWRARFTGKSSKRDSRRSGAPRREGQPRVCDRRIAFVASSDAFLKPIVEQLARHNQVRVLDSRRSREDLCDLMNWADLVWLEWCDGLAIEASHLPKSGKIICRLHSYEVFTDAPKHMNWANIDHLVLVSETVGEILRESHQIPVPMTVIHNGIDAERFPLIERPARGKKIASVGYINYKKNPSLLLQTFKAIHDWDPKFELHIAGEHQDARIKVYFDHLLPRLKIPVTFHGWRQDMPAFYGEMDYVISTSLFESFHYSIAEGMLSGCLPLIHSWRGAERLYPNECLFDTPNGAVDLIRRYRESAMSQLLCAHRDHIVDNYNWKDRHEEIDRLLDSILTGRSHTAAAPVARIEFETRPKSDLSCGRVSIVIAAHNNALELSDTIQSALDQTYQDIEVIVSDDGSTDDTEPVLAAFGDRISVVRQVRRGIPAAMNRAIQVSNGRFIAPLVPGDRFAPDKIECQLRTLTAGSDTRVVVSRPCESAPQREPASFEAALVVLGSMPMTETPRPSCVLFDRTILDQTGWCDETVLEAAGESAAWQSLWMRITDAGGVAHDGTPRVELSPASANDQGASAPDSPLAALHQRWTTRVHRRESAALDRTPVSMGAQGCIVMVAASDPDGQLAMWAAALTRCTGHRARLLTHTESKGLPSDLVLRHGRAANQDKKPRSLKDTLAEAESAIRDADLILFAAGLAPGSLRLDARIEDTDEQPFGTLDWRDLARNKRKAAILCGTPSVRGNLAWYRDRFAAKGWPVLTCEPDIHRWLPEARFIPRFIQQDALNRRPCLRSESPMAVVYPGKRDAHEGGAMMRETAARLKESSPDVMFGRYQDMPWQDVIEMKSRAHIGIDRIAVGTGAFGVDSLENSALGLINVVYCDPYTKALLAETIETSDCPWETPATAGALLSVLERYAANPDERAARMRQTRDWFTTHWKEEDMAPRLAKVLESL